MSPNQDEAPNAVAYILDGAALINMLKPGTCTTYNDYAKDVFVPYICNQFRHFEKVREDV